MPREKKKEEALGLNHDRSHTRTNAPHPANRNAGRAWRSREPHLHEIKLSIKASSPSYPLVFIFLLASTNRKLRKQPRLGQQNEQIKHKKTPMREGRRERDRTNAQHSRVPTSSYDRQPDTRAAIMSFRNLIGRTTHGILENPITRWSNQLG